MNKLLMVIDAQCRLFSLHAQAGKREELQQDILALHQLTQQYIDTFINPPAIQAPTLGVAVVDRAGVRDRFGG